MACSFAVAVGLVAARQAGIDIPASSALLISVGVTTIAWVGVTLVTRPVDQATLVSFCRLVQPPGPGWATIRRQAGLEPSPDSLPMALLGWTFGCSLVYSALFGVGSYLYGRTPQALLWGALFAVSAVALVRIVPRLWGSSTS
jgi:solute:Na+ symporter, SSS family